MVKTALSLAFLLLPLFAFTQSIFWYVDFSNGVPIDWTKENLGVDSISWQHVPTEANEVLFSGSPAFNSPTVSNGFAQAFPGQDTISTSQDMRMTTSAIDCSDMTVVILNFHSSYARFATANGAKVGVSTDGINFNYHDIYAYEDVNDFEAGNWISLDISNEAAGETAVYLQFRYLGNTLDGTTGDYYWKIDDITLLDGIIPVHDIAIVKRRIPFNYATPLEHISPLTFDALIQNSGNQLSSNINVTASVEDQSGTVVYSEVFTIDSLLAQTDTAISFLGSYLPEASGNYTARYDLSSDQTDEEMSNNSTAVNFVVGGNTFAKAASSNNYGNLNNGNYTIGNYYIIKTEGYRADSVYFSAGLPGDLSGKLADIVLYKLEENGDEEFSGGDLIPIGYNTHIFNQSSFEDVGTEILNYNTNQPGVALDASGEYIITVAYSDSSNTVFFGYSSDYVCDYETFSVVRSGGIWSWGYGDVIPDVRLSVSQVPVGTTAPVTSKLDVLIFPNPTRDELHIELSEIPHSKEITIQVSNLTGHSIYQQVLIVDNTNLTINTRGYPAGIYFLRVNTGKEQISRRFSVFD